MNSTDMHRAEIIARVKIATGLSLTKLSTLHDLSVQACKQALNRPYKAPEKIISDAIGIPAHLIWPSRYDYNGNRKIKLHSHKSKSITPEPEVSTCKAI